MYLNNVAGRTIDAPTKSYTIVQLRSKYNASMTIPSPSESLTVVHTLAKSTQPLPPLPPLPPPLQLQLVFPLTTVPLSSTWLMLWCLVAVGLGSTWTYILSMIQVIMMITVTDGQKTATTKTSRIHVSLYIKTRKDMSDLIYYYYQKLCIITRDSSLDLVGINSLSSSLLQWKMFYFNYFVVSFSLSI